VIVNKKQKIMTEITQTADKETLRDLTVLPESMSG
jgi:hypothetical protein